ncbi:cation-translocating P-type ATPase [Patescibacteria group bacterium AH-259-L07]|nr:cation-translocating P-type ATPase [Patescibacteria group bacterium AH-259-L07]
MAEPIWHNLSAKKVLETVNSNEHGLTFDEANKRLKKYGRNKLPEAKKFSALVGFFEQFKSPLVYILIIAAAIALSLKEFIDMGIILAAVFINASIGFLQEYKAEKTFDQLKQLVEHKARVLRFGSINEPSSTKINEEHIINSEEVVPGDIIILEAGDIVPADARLIETHNLETKEAALTGESIPSGKKTEILDKGTPLADRENMVYLGTKVVRGKATAVVAGTGPKTELGKIATLIKTTKEDKTPLQQKIDNLAKVLGIIIGTFAAILFIAGLSSGRSFIEMLLVSVAVAVAGIPEGLAIAVTITLAVGMQRMLKKKALTRKLIAAETLGSITTICSDKTGTLTEGKMAVAHVLPQGKTNPQELLKIGLLCNNTTVENSEEELKNWKISGDTTEVALLYGAITAGLERKKYIEQYQRIDEIPFESETMYMATLHTIRGEKNKYAILVKGAPERILMLTQLTNKQKQKIKKEFEELTKKGLRVLGFGQKIIHEKNLKNLSHENLTDIAFMGFIALKDPLREDAKETIDNCKRAGIRPILVTGDHKLTAKTIAQEIGLIKMGDKILEGSDLDKLSDENLKKELKHISVFARVEPKHKIRIVDILQSQGEVVAMTGDGVNDAPAIKSADIGIALGSGSEVTKETADIVLLDDHFKTIVDAIKTGRTIFNNIKKIILYLLAAPFTGFTLIGSSILFGLPLPLLAGQILWVNIIEDTLPAMALSYEKEEKEVLKEKARGHKAQILDKKMKFLIFIIGSMSSLILLGLYLYLHHIDKDVAYIQTMIFIGLGVDSLFYVFSCKNLKKLIWQYNPFDNIFLNASILFGWIMFFVALYVPFFQKILRTVPLNINDWLILIGLGIINLALIEFGKSLFIHKKI